MSTAAPSRAAVTIRRAKPEDAPVCGRICFEAFHKISTDHNFPPDVPSEEQGVGTITRIFSHPGFYCVVAEADGRIVGSNCMDERGAIAGVGPITIDPNVQNRGVGRKLMDAVLDRAEPRLERAHRALETLDRARFRVDRRLQLGDASLPSRDAPSQVARARGGRDHDSGGCQQGQERDATKREQANHGGSRGSGDCCT